MFSTRKAIFLGVVLVRGFFPLELDADGVVPVTVLAPYSGNAALSIPQVLPGSSAATRTMPWVSGVDFQRLKAVNAAGTIVLAGDVSEQLGYVVVADNGNLSDRLVFLDKQTGKVVLSSELKAVVDGGSVCAGQVGGFSFQLVPGMEMWATVVSAGCGHSTKDYMSCKGFMRIVVSNMESVQWVSPDFPTSRMQLSFYDEIFDSFVLARAFASDVDGDGYRDVLIWRKEYSQPTDGGLLPLHLKGQEIQVLRFLPQEGRFSEEPQPADFVLPDTLWYPAGWRSNPSTTGIHDTRSRPLIAAWGGCDDSNPGFSNSELYEQLMDKDDAKTFLKWTPAEVFNEGGRGEN